MTCFAKNEIYSLKWEKCARCAKMRRLVGARVIFFMRQVTAFFLFGCPSPIGQNKKVQFTTNQCYITNKSSFFAKNWTKSPDWGWKTCQSGVSLKIFETVLTSVNMLMLLDCNLVPFSYAITMYVSFHTFLHFENLKVGPESGDIYEWRARIIRWFILS